MTAVGLFGCGLTGTLGGGAADPDVALVDNLTVEGKPMGLEVLIR